MRPRDAVFLLAALALLGALVAIALGGSSAAAGGGPGLVQAPAGAEPAAEPVPAPVAPAPAASPLEAPAARLTAAAAGMTSGVVRGHISLGSEVVANLRLVYVQVKEAINSDGPQLVPFVRTVKEEIVPGSATPEFVYEGIPFSEFGYVVRVFAEGLNGSQQFVQVNADRPIADVVLSVTGGVPFSVLLRDQLRYPVLDTTVFMVPVDDPGRPVLQKPVDTFGAAVFESVLQGEYDIVVGAMGQPRNQPQRVSVLAHAGVRSVTVEVPRGFPVTVHAQTPDGYGIEGAQVKVWATDTKVFREYKGVTNFAGKCVLEHLPPGTYQVDVAGERLQRWSRNVTVAEDTAPEPVIARLVYLSR